MDYNALINAVQNYDPEIQARPDVPLGTLLVEVEAELQPLIKHYMAETTVTLTSVSGSVVLPDNFIEARRIAVAGKPLQPVSVYGGLLYVGDLGYVMTGNKIQLAGNDGTDYPVELTYFARFPSLTVASPTNWVLDRFPGVYIHGLLAKAYRWLKDPNGEAPAKQSQQEALSAISADYARYSHGGNQFTMKERTRW
jgi:hypothetical protein